MGNDTCCQSFRATTEGLYQCAREPGHPRDGADEGHLFKAVAGSGTWGQEKLVARMGLTALDVSALRAAAKGEGQGS